MAQSFTAVDLTMLPAPQVVEALDYEIILAEMLADLRARDSEFTALVESDPAFKILEVAAYREFLIRQRVNDGAKAVMLAYAQKTDLDQIAANYGVARLLVDAGNPDAVPPVDPMYEEDEALRRRTLLSLQGYTTAGSIGAYIFHALSASGDVLDANVTSLAPGQVDVCILSRTGDGAAPLETLELVGEALSAEVVRPLCDTPNILSATILPYEIAATLDFYPGVNRALALAAAADALDIYTSSMFRLGLDVVDSGIKAALHQHGVQKVTLIDWVDITAEWNEAARCTGVDIAPGVTGE